jgi:hypothetical protein
MTIKPLAKMYDCLAVAERAPMMLAAIARDDEVEQQRLSEAAVWKRWRLPDTHGWAFAIGRVFNDYERMQFEMLAYTMFATSQFLLTEEAVNTPGDSPGDTACLSADTADGELSDADKLDLFGFMHDVSAYRFCVNEAAWSMFRDELRIGPDVLPVDDWLFDLAAVEMPLRAPSADELLSHYADWFQQFEHDPGTPVKLVTPATVCAGWRKWFDELAAKWE